MHTLSTAFDFVEQRQDRYPTRYHRATLKNEEKTLFNPNHVVWLNSSMQNRKSKSNSIAIVEPVVIMKEKSDSVAE